MKKEVKTIPVNEQVQPTVERGDTNVFKRIRSLTNKFRLLIAVVSCLSLAPTKSLAQGQGESYSDMLMRLMGKRAEKERNCREAIKASDDEIHAINSIPLDVRERLWEQCEGITMPPIDRMRLNSIAGYLDGQLNDLPSVEKRYQDIIQTYEEHFRTKCSSESPDNEQCQQATPLHQYAQSALTHIGKYLKIERAFCSSLPSLTTPQNVIKARNRIRRYQEKHSNLPYCDSDLAQAIRRICEQYVEVVGRPGYQGTSDYHWQELERIGKDRYSIRDRSVTDYSHIAQITIAIRNKLPVPASVGVHYTATAGGTLFGVTKIQREGDADFELAARSGDLRYIDIDVSNILGNYRLDSVHTEIMRCSF